MILHNFSFSIRSYAFQSASEGRHTLVGSAYELVFKFIFFLNLFFKIFFINKNNNFMSLYGFAFVIFGLRRISFDINSHKREIMTQNNNCMLLYGFAFVIFGLRRISFDITNHTKTTKNTCCFC